MGGHEPWVDCTQQETPRNREPETKIQHKVVYLDKLGRPKIMVDGLWSEEAEPEPQTKPSILDKIKGKAEVLAEKAEEVEEVVKEKVHDAIEGAKALEHKVEEKVHDAMDAAQEKFHNAEHAVEETFHNAEHAVEGAMHNIASRLGFGGSDQANNGDGEPSQQASEHRGLF